MTSSPDSDANTQVTAYSRHNISEYDRIFFHTDDAPVASVQKQAPGAIVLFRLGDFYVVL